MLSGLMKLQSDRDADLTVREGTLRGKLSEADERLKRLYQAIENGVIDPTDPTLKEQLEALQHDRDIARISLDPALAEKTKPDAKITPERIATFVELMRKNLLDGKIPFRRAWLRSIFDRVEVDDRAIRIHGRKDTLERLVMQNAALPSFVRKWRARKDSNL